MSYTLCVQAGLCNRLRAMLSHLSVAKERNNYPLHVMWSKNSGCNGHFNEVFEPIEGIVFKRGPANLVRTLSCLPGPNMIEMNKLLKPKSAIQSIINSVKAKLGEKYLAVHIRSLKDAVTPNKIDEYKKKIDSVPKDCKIFVATDNATTQAQMRDRYKDRAVFSSEIGTGKNRHPLRKTSLGIAVVDLFVCRDAEWFISTTNMPTSYSELISSLRAGVGKTPRI